MIILQILQQNFQNKPNQRNPQQKFCIGYAYQYNEFLQLSNIINKICKIF